MALSALSENKVGLVTIGKDYMPVSIVLPYDANIRNAQIVKRQLNLDENFSLETDIYYCKVKFSCPWG